MRLVPGFKNAMKRPATALAALAILLLPALASPAFAHRIGRWHRHPHRAVRRAIIVGTAVALSRPVIIAGVAHGAIDFDVEPPTTEVHVDGTLRGQVDNFDGHPDKLYLRSGAHRITLVTPDGETLTRKVRITAGHEINLKLDLGEGGGD